MSNYYQPRGYGGGFFSFPPIIKNLLIINGVVFFIQLLLDNLTFSGYPAWYIMNRWFALNPISGVDAAGNPFNFQVWQLITYQFMHGGFWHILFNMFALWMFGSSIEDIFGSKKFLIFYLLAGVSAGLLHLFISPLLGSAPAVTIGASGSVYGVLIAYAMFFPDNYIISFPLFIPIKAKYLVGIYIVIEFLSVDSASSGVAHLAHLGGALFAFLYIMFDKNSYVSLKNLFNRSFYYKSKPKREIFTNPFSRDSQNGNDVQDAKYYDINDKETDQVSQAEIDKILDKISQSGYQNLTEHEKKILFKASKKN
ncbi:MAG: rhomboid family intramembrane serine protease [Ignavibacterium sp.]|nr:rhomboid family intramembrane serine protease [Ignavibacterium sp.]